MTFAFAGRRARDRVGLLAALAATAAVLTAGLGGFTVVADRVLDDGAARLVADADPIARSVVLDGPLRGAEQTARAEEALAEYLPTARVHRQVWGTGTGTGTGDGDGTGAATDSDGDGVRLRILADEEPPAHLIDGAWPAGPGEAAIAAPASKLLGDTGAAGGEIGDEITVDGMRLRIVGIWAADDLRDTAWAGEPSVASGRTDDAVGPVLVEEATAAALAQRARATWTIEPADTTAAGLGRFAEELRGIDDVREQIDPGGGDGLRVRGDLADTLRRAVAAVTGARALLAVPLIVLAAVGALMLGVLVRTLAAARRAELQLMRARGGALTGIAGAATVEAALAAAAGAVIGAVAVAVAHLLGARAGGGGGLAGAGMTGVVVGAVIVLVVAALTAAATASAAALPAGARAGAGSGVGTGSGASTGAVESGRDDVGRSGLRSIAALLGPLVAVAGAAALALAQLMGRGLVVRGELDPLAAAAPALLLIAGALLAALLAGPIAAGAQRLARRTRGLGPVLALRRIARQSSTVAVAVIAVALAAASVVFVAVTGTTATRAAHADVAMVIGADARARFAAPGVVDATHTAVTAAAIADGSTGDATADPTGAEAFAGLSREVRIGDERVTLIAAPVDRLSDGDEGLAALPDLLTADPDTRQPVDVGVLPAAGTVSLSVTGVPPVAAPLPGAEAGETRVAVALWFADVDGVAVRIDGGTVPADSAPHPLAIAAPDRHRLVAIEFAGIRAGDGIGAVYTVVDSDGAVLLGGAVDVIQAGHPVRVLAAPAPQTVPVAMTAALAEQLAADVGDELSLTGGSLAPPLPVRIAAIRPQLPGLAGVRGVLADQGMLTAVTVARGTAVLAAGDVWVRMDGAGAGEATDEATDETSDETTDAGARAAAAETLIRSSAVLPVDVLTASSVGSAAVTDPALTLTVVAVGVAATLAVVAFAVVVVANARRRRAETVPLRSFGFTRAHQRAVSLLEAGMVAVFALAVGAGLGFGVAVLTGSLLVAPVIGGV